MIFPSALCGVWSLVGCSNPLFLGSTMVVDYTNFKFTQNVKNYGSIGLKICRNVYGTVFVNNATHAKVVWSKRMDYSIESKLLPRIPVPWDTNCPRFGISYNLDEISDRLTVVKANEKYVFQRHVVSLDDGNHFYKIFMTQLLFDLLLRHLPAIRNGLEIF